MQFDQIKNKILAVILVILVSVLGYFTYNQLNYKNIQINKALKKLEEFRAAKALDILLEAQSKTKNKDNDVNFLVIYVYGKSNQFEIVKEQLESLEEVPKSYEDEFFELIEVLQANDQVDLINSLVHKSKNIAITQDYLINLSKKRNSINEELKILESSVEYLNTREQDTNQIESYLLKRYLEIGNIYQGNRQFQSALNYLLKAKALKVAKNSPYEDELYLNIGLTYKGLEKFHEAWLNIRKSADMGNTRAKDIINRLGSRYVPY